MVNVKEQRRTGDIVWFGVGCFHFAYQKTIPYKFTQTQYVRDLKAALEAVPVIKDVEINWPENVVNSPQFDVTEEPTPLSHGNGHFPPIRFGAVRFRIYIPFRVQRDIAGMLRSDDTGTENFVVFINYDYEGPITYVVLEEPNRPNCEPSTAVMIVREFLTRELDPSRSPIRFECLGPSPFHADFSLRLIQPANGGRGQFEVKHHHKYGYDALEFTSDHSQYTSAFEAVQGLFYELDHELDPFYWIQATELRSMRAWTEIQEHVAELLHLSERTGPWERVKARFRRSRLLHDVFTSLIGFDVNRTFLLSKREERYRQTYASGTGFLREFVDKEKTDAVPFPTRQITTLVGFLERRRSKAVELGIILLAAVIGGIAGATITHSSSISGIPRSIKHVFETSPAATYNKGSDEKPAEPPPSASMPSQSPPLTSH